jgi:hypothetical protein
MTLAHVTLLPGRAACQGARHALDTNSKKRTMYGRANFDLLKLRVLHAA